MTRDTHVLIADLVDALEPVAPVRFSHGMGLAGAAAALTIALTALLFGIRGDVLAGQFDPVFLLASGLFLMLGLATAATVVMMGRPKVGNDHKGWIWAAAMASLLPAVAVIVGADRGRSAISSASLGHGVDCLLAGSALALVSFAALVLWLRRGAPTSPERAGLLAGIASGCFGIFAYAFHCSFNDIVHIGIWHSLVVVVSAGLGRLAVPKLVRW